MRLICVKEPLEVRAEKAGELPPGTWFVDVQNQIHVVVLDDRTNEKRVVCAGHGVPSVIAPPSSREIPIGRVLQTGTLLQISMEFEDNGGNNA